MNYTCKFSVEVLAKEKFRSPITQGGLEIKSQVKVEWSVVENAKFLVFRENVKESYSFERSDKYDLKHIRKRIMDNIKDREEDDCDD